MYENEIKPQTAVLVAVDTGEATIGGVVIHIRTGATAEHVVRQLHGVLTELVE